MNLSEVLHLKFPTANFLKDIKLCDHGLGNGIEIQEWNLQGVPQPSAGDIATWMADPAIIAAYTAQQNAIANAPIIAQLDAIDAKSIRALRTNDTVRLTGLENQAIELRAQLVK